MLLSLSGQPAWVTENEPAGRGKEENARITKWKRSVEQALIEAEAREHARQQDAATAEDGVDATKAWNIAAQEGEATRIDLGIARELAKKQAETLNASNEDRAAAETKAASASSVAKEAITANDAKRGDTKRANETKGSEPFSDSPRPLAVKRSKRAQVDSMGGVGGRKFIERRRRRMILKSHARMP